LTIENMGVKLYQGLKQDRVSDSLGSSADGTNTGITLVNDYPIFGTSSNGAISTTNYTNDSYTKTSSNNNWDGQAWGSVATKEIIVEIPDATSSSSDTMVGLSTSSSSDTFGKAMIYIKSDDNLDIKLNGNNSPSGGTHSGISIGSNTFFKITDDGSKIKYYQGTSRTSMNLIYTVPDDGGTYIDTTGYPYILQNQQDVRKAILHQNTEAYNPAKLGTGAYDFDGSGDYVEVNGLKTVFNGATKLSVAGWIYPRDNVDETLLGQWNGSGNSDKIMDLHINGSNKLELSLRTGGTNYITTSSTSINENEWQHVAMTYDGATTTVKLYINGTLDVTDTSNPSSLQTGTGSPALFGIYGDKSSNPFDGILDDWGVWSRVLTATEIETLVGITGKSNATASSQATSLGGGNPINTKVGFEVATGHPLVGTSLKAISFTMDKYISGGSVSGNGYCAVYNSSGTQKGSNSSTYAWNDLIHNTGKAVKFTFPSAITIADGDRIVVEGGTYDSSNQIDVYYQQADVDAYSGLVYYNSNGWLSTPIANKDIWYRSYSTDEPELVSSLSDKSELKAYYSMDSTSLDTATVMNGLSQTPDGDALTMGASYESRRGERAETSSSELIGIKVTKVTFKLKRVGNSLTGTASIDITNSSGVVQQNIGTISTTQLNGTGSNSVGTDWSDVYVENTSATYVMVENDQVAITYTGGDGSNYLIASRASDFFDGSNTIRTYGTGTPSVDASNDTIMKIEGSSAGCKNDASSTSPLEALDGVRDNSIFTQTDSTPSSYWWYNGTSWLLDGTTTLKDFNSTDFDTSNWTSSNTSNIIANTTANDQRIEIISSNVADAFRGIAYDLGSPVNDSKWAMRISVKVTGGTSTGNVNTYRQIMLASTTGTSETGNSIGMRLDSNTSANRYWTADNYNQSLYNTDNSQNLSWSSGTTYYFDICRTSSTEYNIKRYTDSTYGSVAETVTGTCNSALDSLQYIRVWWHDGGTPSSFKFDVTKIEIQNGVSEWLE